MKKNIMLGDMRSQQVKIPAISKIKIEHKYNRTTITTTDLERWCSTSWEDKEVGDYVGIVDNLPRTDVSEIKLVEGGLELRDISGVLYRVDFSNDIPLDNYPEYYFESQYSFRISNRVLREALMTTLKVVSKDKTRPALTAIKLDGKNDKLRLTATDGYRLIEYQTDTLYSKSEPVLLPSNTAKKLLKVLKQYGKDEEIEVELSDEAIRFTTPQDAAIKLQFKIYSKLIDSMYPDIDAIMQTYGLDDVIEVENAKELGGLLKRFKDESVLKLSWQDDGLVLDSGRSLVKVENSTMRGDIADIGHYDPKFVLDVLPTTATSVKMFPKQNGSARSVLVKYGNVTAIVMGLSER